MRDSYGDNRDMSRQRDLVLSVNEFVFLQNKTNGQIKTQAGPMTITISQQEALVTFNAKSKKFEETNDFEKAKQLFIAPPEGWYTILKNPTSDGQYPEAGKANTTPSTITIGKKINIPGPASFALFPGQMAKTVRGHKLRSNQYLLARVYDAEAAQEGMKTATIVDVNGEETETKTDTKYFVGQLMVIKGTEISFYIPPTGIEVIPQTPYGDDYVRDAVTLERLEYAILKDEDGEKRYVHGPAVVFPDPTETFVMAHKGSPIFRALELSPISGIYVKVIADYSDATGEHKIGEELFITGNDQMIYYPRPEHAMIQYDGKYMHHAIAIPEGEGRYILDRLKGTIKLVKGPAMYLPDPRTEVVVRRKLSDKECRLMYPGNMEALTVNREISEKAMEKRARMGDTKTLDNAYATANMVDSLALFEANSNISRGVSYTKPRTITLDTKYDGAVSLDIWTGYAVNIVSKSGNRETVIGPTTRLLEYDETIEGLHLSTGKPKSEDTLIPTGYLRIANNKVSDVIYVQTSDFVNAKIEVSYNVNFLEEHKDKWFTVDNYVKFLCDRGRSLLRREVKKYGIQKFYSDCTDIVRNTILGTSVKNEKGKTKTGRLFSENGMMISDVEVLSVSIDNNIARILDEHQTEMIEQAIQLRDSEVQLETAKAISAAEKERHTLKAEMAKYKQELAQAEERRIIDFRNEKAAKDRVEKAAAAQAESDLQEVLDAIAKAKLQRDIDADNAHIETEKKLAEIEKAKQSAYADTVKVIMQSIQPDLVAAMNAQVNAELANGIGQAVTPYAMANGESVAETVNTLLRGTTVESVLSNITDIKA